MTIYLWLIGSGVLLFLGWFDWNLTLDALWQPTELATIRQIFRMVDLREDDLIYDLGCGDGRVLIEAAEQRGASGIGVEIDPVRVTIARIRTALNGLNDRVEIRRADMYKFPVDDADVVFLFLSASANEKLASKLRDELPPGARIVSYYHQLPGVEPTKVEYNKSDYELYLYEI